MPNEILPYLEMYQREGVSLQPGMNLELRDNHSVQGAWQEESEERQVFRFKPVAVEGEEDFTVPVPSQSKPRRIIPTWVKLEVWKRDDGKCTMCGSMEDLHFDHIIPWSKGGSSSTSENIQLLCGKHNLEKHDGIA